MRAAALVLVMIPALAHADRTYVVRDGDTCLGIANRELGDPAKLETLHALNPQLGKLPHNLKAGQVLNLPGGGPAAADAHLRTMRGRVEVQPAGTENWDAGTSNQQLFRTWRVGTRDRATAKVEFHDLSTIDMREDTVVMIFGSTSGRASTLRTQLERGVLRTRLAALDRGRSPDRTVIVETPAGKAELGHGSAVIDVDAAKETRLANHRGKAAKLTTTRGKVELAPGYGSRAVANQPPSPPIKLLPPPRWERTGELALAWQGEPLTLRGAWAGVPGAVKYRLEIALSTSPLEVETHVEVPGTITKLEATGLPPASYLVTVASVDKDGLEGPPSAPLLIQSAELTPPRAITGGTFEPPQGLRCARGDLAPIADGPPVILVPGRATGLVRMTCASPAGQATLELPVAMPVIRWPSRELTRGTLATVEIELRDFDSARLQTIATGITMINSTPRGDRLEVQLVASAAGRARVAFVIDGVTIAAEQLTVVEPVVSSTGTPVTSNSSSRWGAAAYTGGTFARRDNDAVVGAELWVAPRPWIAPYLGVAKLSGEREGSARFGLRTAFDEGLHPIVRAGLVFFGSERVGGELGAGIEWTRRGVGVRAEATGVAEGGDRYVQGVVGLTFSR